MHRALFGLFIVAASGCGDGNGLDVGRFDVEAVRTESCGDAGLLASVPAMSSKVWLRRVGDKAMHWDDGRGRMMGIYDAGGRTFVAEQRLTFDMRQGVESETPCSIVRRHVISGTLDAEPEHARALSGEQRFDYAPVEGSICTDLLEDPSVIGERLPCSVVYDLSGERL